jgi:hypothetical protein
MEQQSVRRTWIAGVLTAVLAGATIATVIVPDWVEVLFGVGPDRGSGALEWALVLALVTLTAASALVTGHQWRALQRARSGSGGVGSPW